MHSADCPLCKQLQQARAGAHAMHVADLRRVSVFLSENQGFSGWCVLVLREHVEHLSDLSLDEQMAVFREVAVVAGAIRSRFAPVRINYECLGNVVPHVHWHVIPRYGTDPDARAPVWGFSPEVLRGKAPAESMNHSIVQLRSALGK